MTRIALAALACLAGCTNYGLERDMAELRAEIESLERDVPPEGPLWVREGDNAFDRHLEDFTARVPDFIYNHVLGKLAKGADADFVPVGDFSPDTCASSPATFRGRFWHVRGSIGSLRAQGADSHSGVREVHSALVWCDNAPVLVHVLDKPEVLVLHQDSVEFTGIFLKILRFRAKDGVLVDAPFFLARSLRKFY